MLLTTVFNSINPQLKEIYINELLKCNEKTEGQGLVLSTEEIKSIIEARDNVLHNYGRIELGFEVTKGLIETLIKNIEYEEIRFNWFR